MARDDRKDEMLTDMNAPLWSSQLTAEQALRPHYDLYIEGLISLGEFESRVEGVMRAYDEHRP